MIAIFVYLGLFALPVLALTDVFIDFPRGDQDWKTYLMYWPPTMLFSVLIGLLADGLARFLLGWDKNQEGKKPNRLRQ